MRICRKLGAVLLTAALAVSLGLSALPVTAGAAYTNTGSGDITVRLHFHPGDTNYSTDTNGDGIQRYGYRLYQIATIDADGKGFTLTDEFKDLVGTRIPTSMTPYDAYTAINWDLVHRTGTYINERSPEPSFAAPLVDGEAVFSNLPAGLYLGSGPSVRVDNRIYTPVPFVICLPYMIADQADVPTGTDLQAGVYYDDVGITVKFTYRTTGGGGGGGGNPPTPSNPSNPNNPTTPNNPPTPTNPTPDTPSNPPDTPTTDIPETPVPLTDIPEEPTPLVEIPDNPTPLTPATPPKTTTTKSNKPKLPQTGALWWPVPVMGGGGGLLMCAGLLGRRKNK